MEHNDKIKKAFWITEDIGSERFISPVSPCRRMWKRLLRT